MKNRSEIWLSVLEDLGNTCSVSTHEDAEYLRSRVSAEGDSFFTITLPQFAKDLERSLADGELSPFLFKGFARRRLSINVKLIEDSPMQKSKKMAWGVPLFLSGFTRRLFMEPDEWYKDLWAHKMYPYVLNQPPCLLVSPSSEEEADIMADAIFSVRQLCGLFAKEKLGASAEAEKRAVESYVKVDKELDRPL